MNHETTTWLKRGRRAAIFFYKMLPHFTKFMFTYMYNTIQT